METLSSLECVVHSVWCVVLGSSPLTSRHRIHQSFVISDYSLSPHEFLVFDPVRLVGGNAESLLPVFFILRVITVEPDDLAISFKCKDMRGDTVEEPAIVRYNDCTSGKVHQRFFQSAKSIYVQVI